MNTMGEKVVGVCFHHKLVKTILGIYYGTKYFPALISRKEKEVDVVNKDIWLMVSYEKNFKHKRI